MVNDLETKLHTSNRYLETAFEKEKEQQELMLQLQIQLDTLMQNKPKNNNNSYISKDNDVSQNQLFTINKINESDKNKLGNEESNNTKSRAKTAPNTHPDLKDVDLTDKKQQRTVNSSPALFTLERVMQSFRARSQILAETLEENDNVMQNKHFNSTFDISTDVINEFDDTTYDRMNTNNNNEINDGENDENNEEQAFTRKGTFKINKTDTTKFNSTKQETKRVVLNQKETNINSNNNNAQETQKKLRDLSINIK
jgi:hypothetical protein